MNFKLITFLLIPFLGLNVLCKAETINVSGNYTMTLGKAPVAIPEGFSAKLPMRMESDVYVKLTNCSTGEIVFDEHLSSRGGKLSQNRMVKIGESCEYLLEEYYMIGGYITPGQPLSFVLADNHDSYPRFSSTVRLEKGNHLISVDAEWHDIYGYATGDIEVTISADRVKPIIGPFRVTFPKGLPAGVEGVAAVRSGGVLEKELSIRPLGRSSFREDQIAGDLNFDGKLDILDIQALIKAMNDFQNGNGIRPGADMNYDGAVDIRDLVALAKAISAVNPAAAPSLDSGKVGITSVGQNFPNPFNPETWIPFSLGQTSRVTVSIFNARGDKIRSIDLGVLHAGIYADKSSAVYWDGRDYRGEVVPSGLYFYRFSTDGFSTVRKMIVIR